MIYFLHESFGSFDGASRSAADFLHHLLELDRDVTVVSRDRPPIHSPLDGSTAHRVRWVPVPPAQWPSRKGLGYSPRKWLWWLRTVVRHTWRRGWASSIVRLFPPAVAIHNEFPYPGSYAHSILQRAPKRIIIVHTPSIQIARYLRRRKVLTPELAAAEMARTDGLVFVSPQLREDWAKIASISQIPQSILSNTCREDDAATVRGMSRDELRTSLRLPLHAFIAVCVGYVHEGKGQDTLIDALPDMVRTRPDLLLVFVGNDKSEWAMELKKAIDTMGVAAHVRFVGERADSYAFIRAADLMIHPSRGEGQGVVLLEAMLLRTPVLASAVGGIPWVITHGETGWLVPSEDPDALVTGFRRLVTDDAFRHALTDRAEREYWGRFSRHEYGRRFRSILESVLASSRVSIVPTEYSGTAESATAHEVP